MNNACCPNTAFIVCYYNNLQPRHNIVHHVYDLSQGGATEQITFNQMAGVFVMSAAMLGFSMVIALIERSHNWYKERETSRIHPATSPGPRESTEAIRIENDTVINQYKE